MEQYRAAAVEEEVVVRRYPDQAVDQLLAALVAAMSHFRNQRLRGYCRLLVATAEAPPFLRAARPVPWAMVCPTFLRQRVNHCPQKQGNRSPPQLDSPYLRPSALAPVVRQPPPTELALRPVAAAQMLVSTWPSLLLLRLVKAGEAKETDGGWLAPIAHSKP